MPRPRKCRRVCSLPQNDAFVPVQDPGELPPVILAVDEYETIRLIDREGCSQEECGAYMKIARASVQTIYAAARKKIADALVEGRSLRIEGGDYRLCDGRERNCGFGGCRKRQHMQPLAESGAPMRAEIRRIAVAWEDGQVFFHFGHTKQFKLFQLEAGELRSARIISAEGSGHGALAGFLKSLQADAVICGGIGGGARMALAEAGIQIYGGVSGDADAAVEALLRGDLDFDPNASCSHSQKHNCGERHCGK